MKNDRVDDDKLLMAVSEFVFEFSNVCWNLAEKGEHKKAQELGVGRLMSLMPKLTREFLARTAVEGSPFQEVVEVLDDAMAGFERQAKGASASNARKKRAK